MQFRTEINIPNSGTRFSRTKGIITIGSCFAEVVGRKLQSVKANTLVNPFGTIFNPLSANKLIRTVVLNDTSQLEEGLVQRQDLWFHYDFHSSFHHAQPEKLIEQLRETIQQAHEFLMHAQAIMLTWGTAFLYERIDTGAFVANCHKVPQKSFTKRLLTIEEISEDTRQTLELLRSHCPTLQIILTVSPVRHIKDTLPLNSVSKSILRVAAHLAQEFHPMISYFPAYELLLDDLRDYRYYGSDLIHPSEMAEQYIWEKFIGAYADKAFASFLQRWSEVQRDLNHHPFNPDSASHQSFLRKLLERLQQMALEADVQEEIAMVQRQLHT
ncbi:GSCFA domain-containing protein [Rufibacter roseus]|uniref:GSCFA domain-containing protein n=1 Tax=Rufibacter roseus TaxID=1567108 RepID=A0ABW2DLF6_9BACT|nr:GSCFA domain-containing protein [Rufibacter roseus]